MRNYRNDNERFERYDREERGNYNGSNSYGNRQDRYGQEAYQDESRSYSGAFGRGEEYGTNQQYGQQSYGQQGYNQQGTGRQEYNQQGQYGHNRPGQDHDYRREESRDWQGGQRYDRGHGEGYHNLETEYGNNSRSGSENRGQENRGQYDYDRNSRGNFGRNTYSGQYDYENNNRNRGGNYSSGLGNSENYGGGRTYGNEGNYGNSGNYGGGNTGRGGYSNAGGQYGNQQQPYTDEQYGQRGGSSKEYPRYNEQSRQGEYGRGNYNDNSMREEERGYSYGPSSSNSSYTDTGYEGQHNRSDRSDSVFGMGPRSGRGTRGW